MHSRLLLCATALSLAAYHVPALALERHAVSSQPTVEIHLEALDALRAGNETVSQMPPQEAINAQAAAPLTWQQGLPGQVLPQSAEATEPKPSPKRKPKQLAKKEKPAPTPKAEVAKAAPPPPPSALPPVAEAPPPPPPMAAEPPPPPPAVAEASPPIEPPSMAAAPAPTLAEPPPMAAAEPPPPPAEPAAAPSAPQLLGQMSAPDEPLEPQSTGSVGMVVAEAPPAPSADEPKPVELIAPPQEAAAPPPEPAPEPAQAEQQVASVPPAASLPAVGDGAPAAHLTFGINDTAVGDAMKSQLAPVIAQMKNSIDARVSLVAYASGISDQMSTARRVSLARALAVRAYLIDQGVDNLRINVQAEGNKATGGEGDRVDVFLLAPQKG